MAIVVTNLATAGNNVDATSFATASITPVAYTLTLAWVYSIAASAPNTPTATGNGLTWVQVATIDDGSGLRRLTLFRAMGPVPSAGALTFDFAGQTQTGCAWSVAKLTGVHIDDNNGAAAVVQSATNFNSASVSSLTVTLGAMQATDNVTLGGFGIPLNTAAQPAVGSNFTLTGQVNQASPNLSIGSEYTLLDDTTVDMNCGVATVPWTGIAVEVRSQLGFPNNYQFVSAGNGMSVTEKIR